MPNINHLQKPLENIGLNKNEAKFYLTSLTLGPASAIQLSQKIGITRQMVYTLLPALIDKGLIKRVEIDKKTYFQAVEPKILTDLAEKTNKEIKEIVPILESQEVKNNAVPIISVYENLMSMREWYRQFMSEVKKGEELLIWSSGKAAHWYQADKEFYDKYLRFSDKQGVKSLIILPDNNEAREFQKKVGTSQREYRFSPRNWQANAEKWIWRNQICYLTIKENATNMIVLESRDLAELERNDFWAIWETAKKN